MPFPSSPTNGQTYVLNNTSYTYNSALGTWTATQAGVSTPIVIAANTAATSATTGALQVVGGIGVQGNIYTASTVVMGSPFTMRNKIINGAMQFWQRGTSASVTGDYIYLADRWEFGYSGTATASQQTGETGICQYALRVQRNSGQTSTVTTPRCGQSIEVANCVGLQGANVTLTFRARAGSNYSGASNVLTSRISTGTGTDTSSLKNGFTGQVDYDQSNTLTTSFQTFTQTVTLGSNITQVAVAFIAGCSGTAGANDYFDIEIVQLEIGTAATPFEYRNYQQELAMCQRYYEKSIAQGTTAFNTLEGATLGLGGSINDVVVTSVYKVTKRANPTVVTYSSATGTANAIRDYTSGADITSVSTEGADTGFRVYKNSSITANRFYGYQWTASSEL